MSALQRGLATLIARLPEGDDLWAEVSRRWDERIARLRNLVENDGGDQT